MYVYVGFVGLVVGLVGLGYGLGGLEGFVVEGVFEVELLWE